MTERANAQGAQPLANFSALMSGRSQHLADLASERAYEQSAAEAGSQRRIREYTEDERLRAVKEMADQGVPVKSGMSMDELANAKRDFMTQRATTQLGLIQAQMDSARSKQQQAFDAIHRIAASPNLGTKEQRLQALRVALNDPSAARLPDSTRAALMATLAKGEDPAKQLDQAITEMGSSYFGSKGSGIFSAFQGLTQSQRLGYAQAFQQAYLQALQPAASETQKTDLISAMKMLDDSSKQVEALNQQAFAHFGANAGFLPKEALSDWTAKHGAPANPNDVMSAAGANRPQVQAAAPRNAPPPTNPMAPRAPAGADIQQSMNAMSATGGFAGRANVPVSGVGIVNPFANVIPDEPSPLDTQQSAANAQPTTPGQVAAFRAATIAQSPRPGVGGTILVQATPQEKTKVETMVRAGLQAKGLSQPQIDAFISQSNDAIAKGNPTAIQSANQLLRLVRQSGQAPPAPVTADQGQAPFPTPADTGASQ
jgi:hypothetical protein